MTKYSIFWKKKTTGHQGNGTHAFEDINYVKIMINELNKKHPDIYHYYKEVSPDTPLVKILKLK